MRRQLFATIALTFGVLCCRAAGDPQPPSCEGTSPPPADLPRAERVILVTIDGLQPELLHAGLTPTLDRMVAEGATTLDARTVRPSLTLPAHVSMVSGLPPERHGVLWNVDRPDLRIEVPTVFDAAREAGLQTALFAGKDKLRQLMPAGGAHAGSARTRSDREVMDEALSAIRQRPPQLALIHLPDVDVRGHMYGWLSDAQREASRLADEEMTRLIDTLRQLGLLDSTLVIVTSDHGGQDTRHGPGRPVDLRVPWIAWRVGVPPRRLPPLCVTATATVIARALGLRFEVGGVAAAG